MRPGLWLAVAALTLGGHPAQAFQVLEDQRGTLNLDFDLGGGAFFSQDDYTGQNRDEVNWTEGFGEVRLNGDYRLDGSMEIYGQVSALATVTEGDGDPGGFTTGNEGKIDLEDAFAGIRTGPALGGFVQSIDISGGSQDFMIGDAWLIGGDNVNVGKGLGEDLNRGGAFWLAPRKAFRKTAIARVETATPLRGDIFFLGSETEIQADTDLIGVNTEYVDPDLGTLGAYYLYTFDVNERILGGFRNNRDGLNTVSVRGQGSLGIDNLFLSAEATLQRGDPDAGNATPEVEAHAWYAEAGYQFTDLPLAPQLTYRFSSFTGDDPTTDANEGFDPLFYGWGRGYGTWFQGEVAGNFTGPFNTNANIHHGALYLHPSNKVRLGALYFDFTNDETAQGISDNFARELDIFAEWVVSDNLFLSPVYSFFDPKKGLEQTFGTGETNHYFQIIAVANF